MKPPHSQEGEPVEIFTVQPATALATAGHKKAMLSQMASDPQIQAEIAEINEEFVVTEMDGLGGSQERLYQFDVCTRDLGWCNVAPPRPPGTPPPEGNSLGSVDSLAGIALAIEPQKKQHIQNTDAILARIRSRPKIKPQGSSMHDSTMLIREDRDR